MVSSNKRIRKRLSRKTAGTSRSEKASPVIQRAPAGNCSAVNKGSGFNHFVMTLTSRDARRVQHCTTICAGQGFKELTWPTFGQTPEKWLTVHHHPRDQAAVIMKTSGLLRTDTEHPQMSNDCFTPIPAHLGVTEIPAHTYTLPEEAMTDSSKPRIVAMQKVQPAIPRRNEYLSLSNMDRLLSSMYPQTFFVFKSPAWKEYDQIVSALKKSLAEVLVYYYPFAGQMKDPELGQYKIHCNGVGADFAEAHVDSNLEDFDYTSPSRSFAAFFLPTPIYNSPVLCPLSIQITRFRCGGIILGSSFHHQVADFSSFLLFLQAWTQAMRGQPITTRPYLRRTLLRAKPRQLPLKNHAIEYCVQQKDEQRMPRPVPMLGETPVVSKCFHLNTTALRTLKRMASDDGKHGPFSTTVCTTAYFWRLIMRANGYRDEQVGKIVCSIDGRTRLQEPHVPRNYFGNLVGLSCSSASIGNLLSQPLSFAATLIQENMQRVISSDHFRSLIDWVEAQKPRPVNPNFNIFSDPVIITSSLINAPLYDVDFGLGKPTFVGYGSMPDGVRNVLWLQPSPHGRGNLMAQLFLRADALVRLESDPEFNLVSSSDYFHPLKAAAAHDDQLITTHA